MKLTFDGRMVCVDLDGEAWMVSSVQLGPVGIGEAETFALNHGCQLPTPALVDAIWHAADLRLDPRQLVRRHDGTPATMSTVQVLEDQAKRVEEAIGGRPFRLVAGAYKDVVHLPDGKVGLYGWHDLHGHPIQPPFSGHARSWVDYSQGLRLCRKVSVIA